MHILSCLQVCLIGSKHPPALEPQAIPATADSTKLSPLQSQGLLIDCGVVIDSDIVSNTAANSRVGKWVS